MRAVSAGALCICGPELCCRFPPTQLGQAAASNGASLYHSGEPQLQSITLIFNPAAPASGTQDEAAAAALCCEKAEQAVLAAPALLQRPC